MINKQFIILKLHLSDPVHSRVNSSSFMTPKRNRGSSDIGSHWVFEYVMPKKMFCLTLPVWDPCTLSSSSSASKNLPRLTGLPPPAAAVSLLPPSASSTGTTVKLVGILSLWLSARKYKGCSVQQERHSLLNFRPHREGKKDPNEVKWKIKSPSEESLAFRLTTIVLTPTPVFSFLFAVWSSVLYTWGESAASCTWGRPKSCGVLTLSLFFSLPFPPTAPRLLPHVTLYLPYEQRAAPPITLTVQLLTHTFVMLKRTKTNSQFRVKESTES